jgi:Fe-S oxidoreductase
MAIKRPPFNDISKDLKEPMAPIEMEDLIDILGIDKSEETPLEKTSDKIKNTYDWYLDGHIALSNLYPPKTKEEENEIVKKFLSGFEKILDPKNDWTMLQILKTGLDYCVRCQTCSEACHVFIGSGRQEIYRPTYRIEILRRIYKKYFTPEGKLLGSFVGADVDLNWKTIYRLAELSHRCNLCRRCAQRCPVGIDNGYIAREIRVILSQELGISPTELLEKGSRLQLTVGSSTGLSPMALKDYLEFIEEDTYEKTGIKIKFPINKKGADILLIHNAGEYVSWPENPAAFAILFDAAGINWTISDEPVGYDSVNYGLWNDDIEAARIVLRMAKIGKDLGVKRVVIGECGHATKAFCVIGDRVLTGDLASSELPRESCLPLFWEIYKSGAIKFDPSKNNFPVTLHDPCNMVRNMGIVMPQRKVLNAIAPRWREMHPNGVDNYCCGGGSGFAVMQGLNFPQWRNKVSSRMKLNQILNAFKDELDPSIPKYVCAPCSNCKGAIRDLFEHYKCKDKFNLTYGGLVELMVNSMVDMKKPYISWEEY